MKLQNLTVIFIIIIIPVILLVSFYISTGLKTINYQAAYDTGLLTATSAAINAFELNTTNDVYSDNAETKRNILKSSVKMFEKSLANSCGIAAYNVEQIEEYIPAILFGMYDGFYMYAPSLNVKNKKYEHNLKNYVYYSETLDDGTVITYSLDSHIMVSGIFENDHYEMKEGYLLDLKDTKIDGTKYKGIKIDLNDADAINYYKEAYEFTDWFLNKSNISLPDYLKIDSSNDPEDENSAFVQHKKTIIKNKVESVLNSSITAYSERTWGKNYKMPKLSDEDWEKVYSNISVISFFQGKNIGLTKYNGYCVLNSTNSNEFVNPNLMYFTDNKDEYHDIRCENKGSNLVGYKIGDFQKIKLSRVLNADGTPKTNPDGKQLYDDNGTETTDQYKFKHAESACYDCINGPLNSKQSVYEYVNNNNTPDVQKTAYWTSLARERYNTTKLLTSSEKLVRLDFDENTKVEVRNLPGTITTYKGANIDLSNKIPKATGYNFLGWSEDREGTSIIKDNYQITQDTTLYAVWEERIITVKYAHDNGITTKTTSGNKYIVENIPNANTSGKILVGWKYNDTTYTNGNEIYIPDDVTEITLEANYIENFSIAIYLFDEENHIISKYSGEENIYTNKETVTFKTIPSIKDERIRYNITGDNNVFNNGKIENGTYTSTVFQPKQGWYDVKVTPVVDGIELNQKTTSQTIVLDRTKPKWHGYKIVPILSLVRRQLYVKAEDELSGIKEIRLDFDMTYAIMQSNTSGKNTEYNYYGGKNLNVEGYLENDCHNHKITITDKAGNQLIETHKH